MRRRCHGCQHLRGSDVRTAKHPNLSIRLVQLCGPFNRIEAILTLIAKRIKLSTRCETTTRVLEHDNISVRGQLICHSWITGSVIRRPCQENWKLLVAHRPIDIRHERHTIAHLYADTRLNRDSVECLRTNTRGSETQK